MAQAAKDNGYWYFDPSTANESEWWFGPNHNANGSDDDPLEWRQSATPGTSVEMSLSSAGNLTLTGDLTISGNDLTMSTNTSGAALIGDGTNYNPVLIAGDGSIAADGTLSVTDLTITGETAQDLIYFDGSNWVRKAKGADGKYLGMAAGSLSWLDVSATAAGTADGQVQYYSSGNLGAEAAFSYDAATNALTAGDILIVGTTNPADAGTIRLENTATIVFEDTEGTGEVTAMTVDASEAIILGDANTSGITVTPAATLTGGIASIGAAADLSGGTVTLGTVDGSIDMSGATDITYKDGTVDPADLAASDFGDFTVAGGTATIDNDAITSAKINDGEIVNADIAAGAAIVQSKLSLTDAAADGSTKGIASFTANDFDAASGNISLDYTNGQKASTTQAGFLTEIAIASEVNTGTDATRAVSPDALAGSNLGTKDVCVNVVDSDTDVATGDGVIAYTVPSSLSGMNLVNVVCSVHDQGVTGTTDVQVRRRRAGSDVDMLSTRVTIGAEYYASDEVINTSNDDLSTGDQIYIDVDAIHSGTAPKGLSVTLEFRLP